LQTELDKIAAKCYQNGYNYAGSKVALDDSAETITVPTGFGGAVNDLKYNTRTFKMSLAPTAGSSTLGKIVVSLAATDGTSHSISFTKDVWSTTPTKDSGWKYDIKVDPGGVVVATKSVQSVYDAGYKEGWNDATSKITTEASGSNTLIKGPKTSDGSSYTTETKYTYKPSSSSAATYNPSHYSASIHGYTAASTESKKLYTASGPVYGSDKYIFYGTSSAASAATRSTLHSLKGDLYTVSGDNYTI